MIISAFASRNIKELLRDPLSYIFCLGFPVIMLIVMSIINQSIPPEANMTVFCINNLSGGIMVFGQTFLMLFTSLLISKDRTTSFLTRLYASPMKAIDFIAGYHIPLIILALIQSLITVAVSMIIAAIEGVELNLLNMIFSIFALLPSIIMFVGFGMFFGCKFSQNAAPGLCSVIISAASFLGGMWMDVEAIGGPIKKVCDVLPFYHSVSIARKTINGEFNDSGMNFLIVIIYMIIITVFSVWAFRKNMTSDKK